MRCHRETEAQTHTVAARTAARWNAIYSRCENRHNHAFAHRNDAKNSGFGATVGGRPCGLVSRLRSRSSAYCRGLGVCEDSDNSWAGAAAEDMATLLVLLALALAVLVTYVAVAK